MSHGVLSGDKHNTGSVWAITRQKPGKVLLIHHKKFGKWMQPGGHCERNENPLEAAVRETLEETGLDVSFLLKSIVKIDNDSSNLPLPNYILEEKIPASGDQPSHFHLDHMYVVETEEIEPVLNLVESNKIGWFTKKEAFLLDIHEDSKQILQEIL